VAAAVDFGRAKLTARMRHPIKAMLIWELLVGFGVVFLIAVLVVLINPPEAWVKRAFLGKEKKK
jgi:hypothetical protein